MPPTASLCTRLVDEALADPVTFQIRREELEASSGVVRFGQLVDELLGIRTELVLNDAGLDDPGLDDRHSTGLASES